MKMSRLSLVGLSAIAGMMLASIGTFAQGENLRPSRPQPDRKKRRPVVSAGRRTNPVGYYPEQSSRQAMRAFRRAQGGPGIELVDGVYVPRSKV